MRLMQRIAAMLLFVASGTAVAQERIALWPNGVPGFESRRAIAEQDTGFWTRNVNDPSITAYLPDPAKATGTAILVVPGGGHAMLVTANEGSNVAQWLAARGVAAFVLRYRLYRAEGSPYALEDARADTERAMRLLRARADRYGFRRIGIMGFSAGGELARMTSLSDPVPARGKGDAIDRLHARPDFALLLYPGPGHADERVSKDAPPILLSAAHDAPCCSAPVLDLMQAYRAAGASAELHLYRAGGHGYQLGGRTDLAALQHSPQAIEDWLGDMGYLGHPAPSVTPHPGPKAPPWW
ncbi:alpha/beta hydrolase [Sphingomonas sp.]|uniref:alpha/beta hydrolase n=1 Tax=Sphingomonas sp. TaxID=28214 RepID=UPI003B3B0A5C